ncbi:hypothetical protein CCACVL1_06693 [Corchorus capsularis]|uniref:Uncharacterized protein n=1 Tax=Corchorus capsularis TaxID=210143 RepID=A0A1R3JDU6_COCAP|nr:hypothetical protein CCACVL1_06693 [Corchorus capsularis]
MDSDSISTLVAMFPCNLKLKKYRHSFSLKHIIHPFIATYPPMIISPAAFLISN